MIIQLEKNISAEQKDKVLETLSKYSFSSTEVVTQISDYLVAIGKQDFDIRLIGNMTGVKDIHKVDDNYKLVSTKWKVKNTKIELDKDTHIGSNGFSIMAGPCSIENEEQIQKMVEFLKQNNVKIMRGGVFKP